MSFWKRWTRRRERPPVPEPTTTGFVSSGYTGRTLHGKQVVRIGDPERFRQEDALRDRARSALDPEDESHAQALVELLGRYADVGASDPSAEGVIGEEVRSIGRRLCEDGGTDRMKLVAFRVGELDPGNPYARVRSMESFWDGICGWQV